MQYSTPVRNAKLQAVETQIGVSPKLRFYSGAVPANPAASIGAAVMLVEMALPSDWLSAPSGGADGLLGTWSGVAAATGTPTFCRVWDTAGTTCGLQATSGVNAGEVPLNGTVTAGQTISVSAFTITEGNP
jgi:hypothetical protein